jgi:hypothetical protein
MPLSLTILLRSMNEAAVRSFLHSCRWFAPSPAGFVLEKFFTEFYFQKSANIVASIENFADFSARLLRPASGCTLPTPPVPAARGNTLFIRDIWGMLLEWSPVYGRHAASWIVAVVIGSVIGT